ncbi:hypothetical protein ACLQ24_20080 [Micromonospora sp. DT4]|uniref:hypothetical protein n=1 Tax=Micromonospora sp. DT4 TaxID=3393438 RepID=UPI003CE6E476
MALLYGSPDQARVDERGIRIVAPFVHDYDGRPDKLGLLLRRRPLLGRAGLLE